MNGDTILELDMLSNAWLIAFVLIILVLFALVWVRWLSRKFSQDTVSESDVSSKEAWHTKTADEVFEALQTSTAGLSKEDVDDRLIKYGPNRLAEAKSRSPFIRFLFQFHNVLIYVLIFASVVTALLQHWVDAGVIFGVVLINAIIGFVQEGKAEDALRAIKADAFFERHGDA